MIEIENNEKDIDIDMEMDHEVIRISTRNFDY